MPSPTFTFTFSVTAADGTVTPFTILSFEGEERISQPFEYRLVLRHSDANLLFEKVLNQQAELVMKQELDAPAVPAMPGVPAVTADDTVTPPIPEQPAIPATMGVGASRIETTVRVKGIVSSFRANRMFEVNGTDYVEYEAVFVPKMWRLGMFHQSRVFQGLTVQEIIERVFAQYINPACDPVLRTSEYEFKLAGSYQAREFCVQYRESDLDFIQRLMEYEGWYYFYENGKLIISDTMHYRYPLQRPKTVDFAQASAGTHLSEDQIYEFLYDEQVVPKGVQVRDYDYEAFAGAESVNQDTPGPAYGRVGTHYEHGMFSVEKKYLSGFKKSDDPDLTSAVSEAATNRTKQVTRIAQVRAQELEAQSVGGRGKSNVVRLQPGHLFDIVGHYRFPAGSAREFLITSVQHEYPVEVQMGTLPPTTVMSYRNTFTCLPATVQYRPTRRTEVPRVPGVMTAKVVGEAPPYNPSGTAAYLAMTPEQQAEADATYQEALQRYNERTEVEGPVDEEGRYRVEIPFDPDPENVAGMSAPSKRVRLAQPHAGVDYGFHFPNRPNTEMVFACIDGDPDRPLGLSVVPNPWTHTPVPNTGLKMRTQNPLAGALVDASNPDYAAGSSDPYHFDEYKNVIRTKIGHQIVMDDNDGGANVGITIQTGSSDSGKEFAGGKNKYWFTRIDMGGYRVKSGAEQIIDGITEAAGYLATLVTRNLREYLGLGVAITASVAEAGNYLTDTYGNTTPVGVNIGTAQAVSIKGGNGVNISSPNLFGLFSSAFIGDEKEQRISQHYLELVTKAVNSIVFQTIMDDTVSEFKKMDKLKKKLDAAGKTKTPWKAVVDGKRRIKKSRVQAWALTILQRSGINISSAGDLKMSSLQTASLVAGLGGVVLKSQGSIEQGAKKAVEIESSEGISISTKGRSYTESSATDQALDTLATVFPPLVGLIKAKMAEKRDVEAGVSETFPIAINNESGDILLHTGVDDEGTAKGKGHIISQAEGTGDVKSFADNGNIQSWCGDGGKIILEAGSSRKNLTGAQAIGPIDYQKVKSKILLHDDKINEFAKKEIALYVGHDESSRDVKIEIKEKSILIKCGYTASASSIELKDNGDITLKGKNITLDARGNVDIKGNNISSDAKMAYDVKGMNIKLSAKLNGSLEGTMVKSDAKGINEIKGPLIKAG